MQKENRSVWTWLGVFLSGGGIYSALEILWRGYTHWTMAVTGGVLWPMTFQFWTKLGRKA